MAINTVAELAAYLSEKYTPERIGKLMGSAPSVTCVLPDPQTGQAPKVGESVWLWFPLEPSEIDSRVRDRIESMQTRRDDILRKAVEANVHAEPGDTVEDPIWPEYEVALSWGDTPDVATLTIQWNVPSFLVRKGKGDK